MRFIYMFLVGYFVLVVAATLALWKTGVLGHLEPIWIGIGALVVVGVGILVAVTAGKPNMEITKK